MANTFFQFKKFIIHQDACAMKVCTDACILGAWFAEKVGSNILILDIGTGTGLQMLMLAQKCNSPIDGIEIDLPSYKQARSNIELSPWSSRLRLYPGDVRTFSFSEKYDFIISNPPFYEDDLEADNHAENIARHSKELNLQELFGVVSSNLKPTGSFGILLPAKRSEYAEQLATNAGFYLREKLLVKQSPLHQYFRSILYFSRLKEDYPGPYELCITDASGKYSPEFAELLKDYYLAM